MTSTSKLPGIGQSVMLPGTSALAPMQQSRSAAYCTRKHVVSSHQSSNPPWYERQSGMQLPGTPAIGRSARHTRDHFLLTRPFFSSDPSDAIVVAERFDPERSESVSFVAGEEGGYPCTVFYNRATSRCDFKQLALLIGAKSHFVELRAKKGHWLAFAGPLGMTEFVDALAGSGTEEDPFILRIPDTNWNRKPYWKKIGSFPTTPSQAQSHNYRDLQCVNPSTEETTREEKRNRLWKCHRPASDGALQAALSYEGFGRFQDTFADSTSILTNEDYTDAFKFVNVARTIYGSQELRREAVVKVLESILGRPLPQYVIHAQVNGETTDFTTDGSHCNRRKGLLYFNTVGRNEGGETYFQALQYYQAHCANNIDGDAFWTSVVPCLVVEYAGPNIRITAHWFGSRIQAEPLTPFLNAMGLKEYSPYQWELFVRALRALKAEFLRLEEFLDEKVYNGDATLRNHIIDKDLPYPFYMNVEGERTILQDLTDVQKYDERGASTRLYFATMPSGRAVIVKFATSYGHQVHQAWANEGYAPAVYLSKRLPGGFQVIAMDLLTPDEGWECLGSLDETERHAVLPVIEEKLAEAHRIKIGENGEGGVLGDCRDQNIFIQFRISSPAYGRRRTAADVTAVNFIDFDWAGVEGVQRYPPLMSPTVAWPERAEMGQLIWQSHDRKLLNPNAP